MGDVSIGSSRLLALPLELKHMVVEHTSKKELKALRASNRFFRKLLTPILFRSFNVYPHVRSLEYLINIAESPHLGPHIRALRYDAGYVGVTDLALRRLQSVYSAMINQDEKKATMEHARFLNSQALPADNALDEMALMSYLERALAALPHLHSIQVLDISSSMVNRGPCPILPAFYEQLVQESCGRFEHTRLERGMLGSGYGRTTYLRAMLMALRKLKSPLVHFEVQGVRWGHLLQQGDLGKHAGFWKQSFEGLRFLQLATANESLPVGPNAIANLQTLLKPAVNLEELSIRFRCIYDIHCYGADMKDENTGVPCQSVFQTHRADQAGTLDATRLTWSNTLRTLSLEGLICTVKEIKTVLKQSAPTLRRLELCNFVLMPDTLPGKRACLVELLRWMQKHLQLEEMFLAGFLTNGGMQAWFIDMPVNGEESLLVQVQNFVVKGGPNPLEHVAIAPGHFDLHKKTYVAKAPESLMDGKHNGDSSFSMEYEDDEESEEEDFDDEDDDEDEDSDIFPDDDLYLGPNPHAFPVGLMMGNYDPGDFEDDLEFEF